MTVDKKHPAIRERLDLHDMIVLNGKVEWVEHRVLGGDWDWDNTDTFVGIVQYLEVPTFDGTIEREVSKFAFSPEMEERIGWRTKAANVRMVFSDGKIDPHTVQEDVIMSYYGAVEREFSMHYSELSGYLWTDEKFEVGGHSLIEILKAHIGEYVHMEIELYE